MNANNLCLSAPTLTCTQSLVGGAGLSQPQETFTAHWETFRIQSSKTVRLRCLRWTDDVGVEGRLIIQEQRPTELIHGLSDIVPLSGSCALLLLPLCTIVRLNSDTLPF